MEWFWIVVSAILAGIGTGLAGLSAATVMVPILIVLCPSFSGETGAYQATAIALASDVLGSAVTSYIYIKHKNIDLKRGWLMFLCIVLMCTLGSVAAWKAGNAVLGGFTLFLTFFIGIRFLIKPDTERKETVVKGQGLNLKGILISLFFGLTIGFGSGFVGSGGGMMMLVVFTAFLGMELKSSVGTSTLIMTFTALIASVSHIVIHPAILFERGDVLLVCIITATASSLVSAQFANRVSNRTIGLVTGAVLTVLGAIMILLNYWDLIQSWSLVMDVLVCFAKYLRFVLPVAFVLLVCHFFIRIPKFVFRKMLHAVAFCSSAVIVYHSDGWLTASLVLVLFAVIVYPILMIAEKWKGFSELLTQKKTGEIKTSLLQLFLTDAALVALCGGLFHQEMLAIAAIMMWGCGDAAAALVGIPYGKHKVHIAFADENKSWEGTLAMFAVSFVIGVLILSTFTAYSFGQCILMSIMTSCAGAYTELISHGGIDTITVPSVNALILILCTCMF